MSFVYINVKWRALKIGSVITLQIGFLVHRIALGYILCQCCLSPCKTILSKFKYNLARLRFLITSQKDHLKILRNKMVSSCRLYEHSFIFFLLPSIEFAMLQWNSWHNWRLAYIVDNFLLHRQLTITFHVKYMWISHECYVEFNWF